MKIDILASPHFTNFNVEAKRGPHNTGGGMSVLVDSVRACLMNRYEVNICTSVSQLTGRICIVETCFFLSNIQEEDYLQAVKKRIECLKITSEKENIFVVLFCAEMSFHRLRPWAQRMLLDFIDAFMVTDPYIYELLRSINVTPTGYLCDAINPDLFRPAEKELSVIAVGALKYIKNVDFIFQVFQQLEGKLNRIYMGSAVLWGKDKRLEDQGLVKNVEVCTEEYYPNASSVEVAYQCAHAAFAVNDTWHDCSSRSNEELLLAGVISLGGMHPLFRPRPGFFGLRTPEACVDKMAELTNDFTALPDPSHSEASRQWALEYVSTNRFMTQFESIVRLAI